MKTPFIYLDYNASTPMDSSVGEAIKPFLTQHYGNPSSSHAEGIGAKRAIEKAREQVAKMLGSGSEEIIFTSGGTEANNLAIIGTAMANRDKGNHIITTKIEHPAVTEVCKYLESQEFEVTYLEVDQRGIVDPKQVLKAITPKTILITVMHANNETGSIQPITEIGKIANEYNVYFHTDAAQSIGKIETKVDNIHVDLLSVAGHKFYGPKGIGALYIRKGTRISKILHGANHESNLRPGTENALLIVGLGQAAEIANKELKKNAAHLKEIRDYLLKKIREANFDFYVNGNLEHCLPNTLNLSFNKVDANAVILDLKEKVALSAGSACHSGTANLSNVIKATLTDYKYANGTFRFSVGKHTTKDEIDRALEYFKDSLQNSM